MKRTNVQVLFGQHYRNVRSARSIARHLAFVAHIVDQLSVHFGRILPGRTNRAPSIDFVQLVRRLCHAVHVVFQLLPGQVEFTGHRVQSSLIVSLFFLVVLVDVFPIHVMLRLRCFARLWLLLSIEFG